MSESTGKQMVTVVRIYIGEHNGHVKSLLKRLHDWENVRGVTVFRGIAGYGDSGVIHEASLVDLSLDLPIVVEFFEDQARAAEVIADLRNFLPKAHILSWQANLS